STAAKLVSNRRGSTSTMAPAAPRARSFHMNQNRCWPGVPNRESTSSSRLVVMRPESSATVGVVLPSMLVRSSAPLPASVRLSSVLSGVISLTEATRVVLPTPKPPATRIFTDSGAIAAAAWAWLECTDTFKNPLQEIGARHLQGGLGGIADDHVAAPDQVAD